MNSSTALPFPASGRDHAPSQADEEPPQGDLVTVTRVFNSLEAEMLRGCLQAEGIPASLGDAQTIQTDTLLTLALGGIRVMVPTPFADAARRTVEAFERGELAIAELPDDALPADTEASGKTPATGLRVPAWAWVVLAIVVVAVIVF